MAEQMDEHDQEALKKTMELLQNRMQREKVMKDDPEARQADETARQLLGDGADLEKFYKLSAQIFRNVAKENGGNVNEMMKQITKGKKDPHAFLNNMTDEQKAMIKELGLAAEGRQLKNP